MDRRRIELLLHACKAHVLPLSLTAQDKNETDHQGVFLGYGPNDCHDYPLTTLGSKESPPNGARDRFQNLVDAAGLEPAMPFGRKIYSLLGLPIFLHIHTLSPAAVLPHLTAATAP